MGNGNLLTNCQAPVWNTNSREN